MTKKVRFTFLFSMLLFTLTFVLFYYIDLKSLTIWTVNIWDTLAETGNIRNFYEYSSQNIYGLGHKMVGNDLFIYLPWAIWNLPIWLLQRFGGISIVEHWGMLLYSKMFLVVLFAFVLYFTKKIAMLLTSKKEFVEETLFLTATSFFTVTSIAYVGQNDVIVIVPFLAGLYELLNGKQKKFIFWASVSIAFKPFFAFSYVALILLREKNLLKIGALSLTGFSFYILQKILFIGAPLYAESMSYGPTKGTIKLFIQSSIDIPPEGASLFVLGMGVVWMLAYFCKSESQQKEYIIYFGVAPLIMLFLFTRYEAYRPFYLVPVLYLLMLTKAEYRRINLLLETIMTGTLMYFYLVQDTLFYNPNYIFISQSETPITAISEWIVTWLPGYGFQITTAVFVLAMGMMLVINHPAFHAENELLKQKEEQWLLPVRTILYGIPLYLCLILKIVG